MRYIKEYEELTSEILQNKYFLELQNDSHHGTNRYDHCKRVSYLSYLIVRLFKGNRQNAAIGGLLHDFFHGETGTSAEINYLTHPRTSAKNAKKYFNINDEEAKIIETHMYHHALAKKVLPFISKEKGVNLKECRPTSKEGFIVCLSDLLVSIFEVGRYKVRYDTCLYFLFLINIIRY